MSKTFTPQAGSFLESAAFSGVSLVGSAACWSYGQPILAGLFGLVASAISLMSFRDGVARERGLDVEIEATQALKKEADTFDWQMTTGRVIKGIGNIDADLIVGSHLVVVEVKSYGGLRELANGCVVRCNKERTPAARDISQARAQATAMSKRMDHNPDCVLSVIWCPKAPRNQVITTRAGVVLVNGTLSTLSAFLRTLPQIRYDRDIF